MVCSTLVDIPEFASLLVLPLPVMVCSAFASIPAFDLSPSLWAESLPATEYSAAASVAAKAGVRTSLARFATLTSPALFALCSPVEIGVSSADDGGASNEEHSLLLAPLVMVCSTLVDIPEFASLLVLPLPVMVCSTF